MKPTLGAFTYVYNMDKYDYPFKESVKSVIDVVDQFVICECRSQDRTMELAQELKAEYPDKIKVVQRNWVMDFREISSVANFSMDALTTDFAFQVQADEVVHDNSLEELASLPVKMMDEKKNAAFVHYTHFMANYETVFPFIYEKLIRVVRIRSPWKIIGDGVQFAVTALGGREYIDENQTIDTSIQVFHYGKVKEAEKGWQKEWDFQQLYRDLGFPDPKMKEMEAKLGKQACDYIYLFRDNVVNKKITRFAGTHPKVMEERIANAKLERYEQFVSLIEKDLEIKLGE